MEPQRLINGATQTVKRWVNMRAESVNPLELSFTPACVCLSAFLPALLPPESFLVAAPAEVFTWSLEGEPSRTGRGVKTATLLIE